MRHARWGADSGTSEHGISATDGRELGAPPPVGAGTQSAIGMSRQRHIRARYQRDRRTLIGRATSGRGGYAERDRYEHTKRHVGAVADVAQAVTLKGRWMRRWKETSPFRERGRLGED